MSAEPWWLGIAILARHNPNRGFTKGNVYWRTAVSAEEAENQCETHTGADLRDRLRELHAKGLAPDMDLEAVAAIPD